MVTPNVAYDLVERGLATRDLYTSGVKKPLKPEVVRKPEQKPKKNIPYNHRQMNPTQKVYNRKTP